MPPAQGYLHDGHLSLVKAGRDMADVVVSSIYVNPTQVWLATPKRRERCHARRCATSTGPGADWDDDVAAHRLGLVGTNYPCCCCEVQT